MKNFDYLSLDGRSLRIFLKVMDSGSVSQTAAELGLTQSAVSHTLDKLRQILGDPLFVRAGRGIVATSHARALDKGVRQVLDQLRGLVDQRSFEPLQAHFQLTIAANDFQRDLLLPALMRRLAPQAPGVRLKVIPSGNPAAAMLREKHCDLILTPRPPDGPDIVQKKLFEDQILCYYDPQQRQPPASLEEYLTSDHISVAFGPDERNIHESHLQRPFTPSQVAITLPNFAGIPLFLRHSKRIATLPGLMRFGLMRGFAWALPPFQMNLVPMYMVWHRRDQQSAAQGWVRDQLEQTAVEVFTQEAYQPGPE